MPGGCWGNLTQNEEETHGLDFTSKEVFLMCRTKLFYSSVVPRYSVDSLSCRPLSVSAAPCFFLSEVILCSCPRQRASGCCAQPLPRFGPFSLYPSLVFLLCCLLITVSGGKVASRESCLLVSSSLLRLVFMVISGYCLD